MRRIDQQNLTRDHRGRALEIYSGPNPTAVAWANKHPSAAVVPGTPHLCPVRTLFGLRFAQRYEKRRQEHPTQDAHAGPRCRALQCHGFPVKTRLSLVFQYRFGIDRDFDRVADDEAATVNRLVPTDAKVVPID